MQPLANKTSHDLSIEQQLKHGIASLYPITCSSQLDAELLLASILGKDRSYFKTWPEKLLTEQQVTQYHAFLAQRIKGIPIAYILGEQEFWSIPLKVTEAVLIPRADTERLVELSLLACEKFDNPKILELGTGSGAIAIALSNELMSQAVEITAIDYSSDALDIAQYNAKQWQKILIHFIQSNWYQALDKQRYDVIISNPPYIEENDPHLLDDIRYEPQRALVSGKEGLDDIRVIIKGACSHLNPQGELLIEHGFEQANAVQELFQQHNFTEIKTYQDYAGLDRVTVGKLLHTH